MKARTPTGLGRSIVGFFQDYLPTLRGMSRHTIQSYSIPHVSWDIRSYMRGGGLDAWILFDRLTRTRAGGG